MQDWLNHLNPQVFVKKTSKTNLIVPQINGALDDKSGITLVYLHVVIQLFLTALKIIKKHDNLCILNIIYIY